MAYIIWSVSIWTRTPLLQCVTTNLQLHLKVPLKQANLKNTGGVFDVITLNFFYGMLYVTVTRYSLAEKICIILPALSSCTLNVTDM
jgi:hypothetical protein